MTKLFWAASLATLTLVGSCTLFSSQVRAQVLDDFTDGNFNADPKWQGDESKFAIVDKALSLNAPSETSVAYLSTPSRAIEDGIWEVVVKMAFNPSGSNFCRIYLISDNADLAGNLNGYFVLVGGTDDEVSLYRQSGKTLTKIIAGQTGLLNTDQVDLKLRATRDTDGVWQLFTDDNQAGSFTIQGSAVDDIFTIAASFGIYCKYTATRSTQFSFDNINVQGEPSTASIVTPKFKDIIITEIFADPSPTIELPSAEFVELYNRTDFPVRLSGWTLSDGSSTGTMVGKTIPSHAYLILTPTSFAEAYIPFGDVLGVKGFPSLNNGGDPLTLKSSTGERVDSVRYSDGWYKSTEKKKGGWTLELIDVDNTCSQSTNWIASEDLRGGTPGSENSVKATKPDLHGPKLLSVIPIAGDTLQLTFDENLANEFLSIDEFQVLPERHIQKVLFSRSRLDIINVVLTEPLDARTLYTFTVSNLRDCSHNLIQPEDAVGEFALAEQADIADIVINEILFNPFPGGVDFIELYNNSEKYIDINGWSTGYVKDATAVDQKFISANGFLFKPHSYIVISSDIPMINDHYSKTTIVDGIENDLPAMNDDSGSIAIISNDQKVIDMFSYSEDFHSPLLKNVEGVSLERISFNAPTQRAENWKSASSTVGFATPGYVNSNSIRETQAHSGTIVVAPEVFDPQNGSPNFSTINFNFDTGGKIANVKIVDAQGRLIKTIAQNELLGAEGFFRWDGDTDQGDKARVGYYVVWLEVFDDTGFIETFRNRIAIAAAF